MFRPLPIAILALTSAGAAHAAGPTPVPAEPVPMVAAAPAPAPFWEGFYVGGQIGWANGDFELDLDTFDDSSVIGGFTAGYLWSLGNGWYLGPEFQYDFADMTITDPDTGDTASFEEIARLKLIAGYEVGNGLLYGSAGIAYASIDGIGDFFDGDTSNYVLGLGYDWRVGDNWTVGGEYMYQSFDGIGSSGGDVDVNTIQVKASYRF
jgi:outer membrane immunogenic protein